jgi:hypothetical protein
MGHFLKEGGIARYCSELVSCGDHRVLNCYNAEGLRVKWCGQFIQFRLSQEDSITEGDVVWLGTISFAAV